MIGMCVRSCGVPLVNLFLKELNFALLNIVNVCTYYL